MSSIIEFLKDKILIGDDSLVDTPLPIPNREVKHLYADDSVTAKIGSRQFFFGLITVTFLISCSFFIELANSL